jgi:hypothetical protein
MIGKKRWLHMGDRELAGDEWLSVFGTILFCMLFSVIVLALLRVATVEKVLEYFFGAEATESRIKSAALVGFWGFFAVAGILLALRYLFFADYWVSDAVATAMMLWVAYAIGRRYGK